MFFLNIYLFDADIIVLRSQGLHTMGAEREPDGLTVIFIGGGEPAKHRRLKFIESSWEGGKVTKSKGRAKRSMGENERME